MGRYSIEQIIDGLRRRDNNVLQYIYKSYYSVVLRLVTNNRGRADDAKDIFQESVIIIFNNIREDPDFKMTCTFQTYLYSVARLLWLKQLRDAKSAEEIQLVESYSYISFEEPKPFTSEQLDYKIYQKAFLQLPPDCQQIIKMSSDGYSQKEICREMGLLSENYISKRKHYCKEFLIKIIKETREF